MLFIVFKDERRSYIILIVVRRKRKWGAITLALINFYRAAWIIILIIHSGQWVAYTVIYYCETWLTSCCLLRVLCMYRETMWLKPPLTTPVVVYWLHYVRPVFLVDQVLLLIIPIKITFCLQIYWVVRRPRLLLY